MMKKLDLRDLPNKFFDLLRIVRQIIIRHTDIDQQSLSDLLHIVTIVDTNTCMIDHGNKETHSH